MVDIVVLEDWKPRVAWLRQQFPKLIIYKALYEDEFIEGLSFEPPIIILDHDLGLKRFDGTKAVDVLLENTPTGYDPLVVLWSQNPVGVDRMYRTLYRNGYRVQKYMYGMCDNAIVVAITTDIERGK